MATADHLQVPRQHGLFNHHGIDLGDGTVAHYLEGREILRSSADDFSQGQPISVIEHANACISPPGARPVATAAARSNPPSSGPVTGAA